VTIGELQAGTEQTRAQDALKAVQIQSWIDQLEESYQALSMDSLCFREMGTPNEGETDDLLEDAMIAAMARLHELVVATRNERDFASLGVQVFNLFKASH
jgi:toxin FitB